MNKNYRAVVGSAIKQSESKISQLTINMKNAEEEVVILEKVNQFFQKVIEFKTETTRNFIKEVINDGLHYVFGEKIQIDITSAIKNNKITYSIAIINSDGELGTKESYGGGVLAVISFLLKLTIHYLDKQYPLIVLDESLTFVSENYQERLSLFIKEISEKFGYDVLLISHQPKLNTHANKIYEITKKNEISSIKEVTSWIHKKDYTNGLENKTCPNFSTI